MLIDRSREKLVNAIIYFANNTKYCGKTKLFKLLYFLDFEHFSITGRSVTGLEYFAWPMGPVPIEIFNEVDSPERVLKDAVQVSKKKTFNGKVMNDIVPLRKFSVEHFSKRELKLLDALSREYADSYADDMVEATHLENLPWHQVYEVEGNKQQLIPYELAIKKSEYEQTIKNVRENEEFRENYK
jgi:uncharacterized phage-associated protein